MMKNKMLFVSLFLVTMFFAALHAKAQTTNADFQQAVTAYQQSPSAATAEKVIKLAVAMDQLPPIPEEARENFVMGQTMFKEAKTPEDFKTASVKFLNASRIAPWWPEARYNLALAKEAAGSYDSAIESMKLYKLSLLSQR